MRVVDFGIAKLADDEDTLNSLTQDGRAPHSPAYASPEQLRGLSNLSPASDVFSLGAVGYQLLTGERPFSDSDRNRMSLGMPVPVPSLRSRNPAIPAPVEGIIQRALSFDPEDRFADAGELATALDRTLRELPDQPLDAYPSVSLPPLAPVAMAESEASRRRDIRNVQPYTVCTHGSSGASSRARASAPSAASGRPSNACVSASAAHALCTAGVSVTHRRAARSAPARSPRMRRVSTSVANTKQALHGPRPASMASESSASIRCSSVSSASQRPVSPCTEVSSV